MLTVDFTFPADYRETHYSFSLNGGKPFQTTGRTCNTFKNTLWSLGRVVYRDLEATPKDIYTLPVLRSSLIGRESDHISMEGAVYKVGWDWPAMKALGWVGEKGSMWWEGCELAPLVYKHLGARLPSDNMIDGYMRTRSYAQAAIGYLRKLCPNEELVKKYGAKGGKHGAQKG